nr:MAG TPA: hypothetical protein [Caudoviricetes sp.]
MYIETYNIPGLEFIRRDIYLHKHIRGFVVIAIGNFETAVNGNLRTIGFRAPESHIHGVHEEKADNDPKNCHSCSFRYIENITAFCRLRAEKNKEVQKTSLKALLNMLNRRPINRLRICLRIIKQHGVYFSVIPLTNWYMPVPKIVD